MDQPTEQRLIRRAKKGEASAFTALIQEHQKGLFGFLLRRCGQPELCEDVVQEAFVRVLKNIDRFDERYRFSTWLYTIARRLMLNALQKRAPRSETEWIEGWEAPRSPVEERTWAQESCATTRTLLEDAMEVLSGSQREVVSLYHQKGVAIQEIAVLLEMPAGTIKSHLHRARKRMRDWIEADAALLNCAETLLEDAA